MDLRDAEEHQLEPQREPELVDVVLELVGGQSRGAFRALEEHRPAT